MKKTKSHLLEGALVGAALGIAAGLLFAPKAGKKLRGDIQNRAADFYKYIAPKVKQLKKMSEAQYKQFIKTAVANYGKVRKLSKAETKELMGYAENFWKHFKKHF